jgi:alkylation response protein AidB-like acyl-CoA dehydrogenase
MPLLSDDLHATHDGFKAFVSTHVEPFAGAWDRDQRIPRAVISRVAEAGHFGAAIPATYSGQGWNTVAFGLLNEAVGRGSASLADVITCQAMVSATLLKWGTPTQRDRWIPGLATGETLAAFALTEPGAGSATQSLTTECAVGSSDGGLIVNGRKKWISCAEFADVFLVFGMLGPQSVAFLVPRDSPGLTIQPIDDMLGFRAAGLAELQLTDVFVPAANIVGKPGFGLSHVAAFGLHRGRVGTACSGAGLVRGCLEESTAYAATRTIASRPLGDLAVIKSLIARIGTDAEASLLLCVSACQAEDDQHPDAHRRALMAKYFTSQAAGRAAADAVQIRGASGCHGASSVSRFYRDAKILEIIEGTTQIHEDIIGRLLIAGVPRDRV